MGLPVIETCCCLCSLKTGTKIIGWFGLVMNFLLLIEAITTLLYIRSHGEDMMQPDVHKALMAVKYIMWLVVVLSLLSGIFSVILLFGVYQEKENLVFLFVVVSGFCVLINIIQILVLLIFGKNKTLAVKHVIATVFQVYFFLVVNSYHRTMDGAQRTYA